jgi:hypothetical protein
MAGDEIRMSLRTPFRFEALKLSRHLYSQILELQEILGMDFTELRRVLYLRLQEMLAGDSADSEPMIPSNI